MSGNFTVFQIEKELGIELTEDERQRLADMRQDRAENIAKDKYHCFHIPFNILCGSMETAKIIADILMPYSKEMKTQLRINWTR